MSNKDNKKDNIDLEEDLNVENDSDSLDDIDELFDFTDDEEVVEGEESNEDDLDVSDDDIAGAFSVDDDSENESDDIDDVDDMFVDDEGENQDDSKETDVFESNEDEELEKEEGNDVEDTLFDDVEDDSANKENEEDDVFGLGDDDDIFGDEKEENNDVNNSLFDDENERVEVEEDDTESIFDFDKDDEKEEDSNDDLDFLNDDKENDDDIFGGENEENNDIEDTLFDDVEDDSANKENEEDDVFDLGNDDDDIFGDEKEELDDKIEDEQEVFEKEESPFSQGEDESPFDDFDEDTIEKDEENSNLKENNNKMKKKRGLLGLFGSKKKDNEEASESSSVDDLLGESKKQSVYNESDVPFQPVIKKGGSTITAVLVSSVFTLSAIGSGVYFGKDYVVNFLFKEKQAELLRLETDLKNKMTGINESLNKTVEDSDNKFLTTEDMDVLFADLNSENIKDMDALREKLENQMSELDSLSKELSGNIKKVEMLEDGDANQMSMIKDLKGTIEEQRQLIRKTIQITLDVIQQNREIEGRIETSIYDKLSSQVREDMRKQRQELYDFSLIEDRITESLNKNAELSRELTSQKQENAKILSELNALKLQYQDLSGDVALLGEPPKDTGNKVIEELIRNSDNTISIRRNDVEDVVEAKPLDVKEKKEVVKDEVFKKINIIGVLEDRFYVKPEDEEGWQMYKIGDMLEGYGKIIKIENQKIYAEKGIVRTK